MGHHLRAVDALVDRVAALDVIPPRCGCDRDSARVIGGSPCRGGFVVIPFDPDLISRRRGPAKKKDDAEDARIACLLALDRFAGLRPPIPHGPIATELRAIARFEYDEQDRRRKRKPRGIGALQLGDGARNAPVARRGCSTCYQDTRRRPRTAGRPPSHQPKGTATACIGKSSVGHAVAEPLMCWLRSPTKSGVIV